MCDIFICSAIPTDVPQVLPMVAQICALYEEWDPAKYGFLPNPAQRYRRWLISQASPHLVQVGVVDDLWVEPGFRGQGVARQLVKQAIDRFQQQGVQQIRLDTAVVNEQARHLFADCGFRASTVEMLMELP